MSAAVGFISGVRSHMALQQPGPTESLPADLALMVEVVGQDVH